MNNRAYTFARLTMVAIALLAVANIAWVLYYNNIDFVATPALVEILMLVELSLYNDVIGSTSLLFALGAGVAVLTVLYALCGLLAKKRAKWFTVGFVLYAVDYVFRLYLLLMDTYPDTGRGDQPVMIVVRILIPTAILAILIVGMVQKKKGTTPSKDII